MQISVLSCIFNGFRASLVFWFFGLIRHRGRGDMTAAAWPGLPPKYPTHGKRAFFKNFAKIKKDIPALF